MLALWPRTTRCIKSFAPASRHVSCLGRSPIVLSAQISPTRTTSGLQYGSSRWLGEPRMARQTPVPVPFPRHHPELPNPRRPRARVAPALPTSRLFQTAKKSKSSRYLQSWVHVVMKMSRRCLDVSYQTNLTTAYVLLDDTCIARFAHIEPSATHFLASLLQSPFNERGDPFHGKRKSSPSRRSGHPRFTSNV